ncbi:uncharacterized protein EDB93DRAFT_1252293 [Suillus bovinus]|uniref:uncharacterized protein n=1 Tax=Suillus bovinus TaxID=48563 RepID=UPI001B86EC55|nr:uncharacterized protein EDB93DRAFT_1252293 [Suillus bovinus]KAG2142232.1 hypothetical protein EDB93DRAFT_1252293 [Suillus bovinus]
MALKVTNNNIEYEELGLLPTDIPPVPSFHGIPLKYISLVTLAVQNSLLTLIMHYSCVSISPSQSYSAPTAVLLNELLQGFISLAIAFTRINHVTPYMSDTPQLPLTVSRFWHPAKVLLHVRRLGREVFSPDCWKLSIPAILYVIQNNLQYVAATNLAVLDVDVAPEADPDGDKWDDLGVEDFDDPLMVSEYVVEIFKYMKQAELITLPNPKYIETATPSISHFLHCTDSSYTESDMKSHFGISSHDKWQKIDGNYNYRDAYYRTIKEIREPFDDVWAKELLEWWNSVVFGNKQGVPSFDISDDDKDKDNLVLMKKQSAKCAPYFQSANSVLPPVEAEPTGNPDISTMQPSTPTTSKSTPAGSTPATSTPTTYMPTTSTPATSPPTTSPPPEITTLSPQQKSIPKLCPIQSAGMSSSSAPSLVSAPPSEA